MKWSGSAAGMLDWAAAGQPIAGETVSGDLHLVAAFGRGVLVAVSDGLGHGPEAAASARAAHDVLEANPELPVEALVVRCHEALRRLRGVVVSLASFDATRSTMTWVGVGNVEAVLLRTTAVTGQPHRERLLLWGGVVGESLPRLRPATLPVAPGDMILLATDGLHEAALDEVRTSGTVEAIADAVLATHARKTDDALVLAARYRGSYP
jgi:phosphoserine phosphatase RsbX